MSATQLIVGQCASFPFTSKGSDGTVRPCSFVLHTSNYPVGCVNYDGAGIAVRAKSVGSFDVTISGHSQNLTQMTPTVLSYTVVLPPDPTQADHFEIGDVFISDGFAKPADPGSDTVTGTI